MNRAQRRLHLGVWIFLAAALTALATVALVARENAVRAAASATPGTRTMGRE